MLRRIAGLFALSCAVAVLVVAAPPARGGSDWRLSAPRGERADFRAARCALEKQFEAHVNMREVAARSRDAHGKNPADKLLAFRWWYATFLAERQNTYMGPELNELKLALDGIPLPYDAEVLRLRLLAGVYGPRTPALVAGLRRLADKYPKDSYVRHALFIAMPYQTEAQCQAKIAEAKKQISIWPNNLEIYTDIAFAYNCLFCASGYADTIAADQSLYWLKEQLKHNPPPAVRQEQLDRIAYYSKVYPRLIRERKARSHS